MVSNSRKRRHLNREKIITAAMVTFHENGYGQTTLGGVARRLSVTDKALYYYFESKDALYLESQNTCSRRVSAVIAAIDTGVHSGLAKVKAYALSFVRQSHDLYPYDKKLPVHLANTEQGRRFHANERSNDEAIVGWIRQGIADGSIRPENPKLLWKWNEGAMLWLNHWSSPEDQFETQSLEDQTMTMLDRSLSYSPSVAPPVPAA